MLPRVRAWLDRNGRDVAALLLRVGFAGFLAVNHGAGKLASWGAKHETFSDPLHISHPLSMAGAIGGELVFPILVAFGVLTRLTVLPTIFTMCVAAFLIHDDAPFKEGEHALLYVLAFAAIGILGPGRWSVDGLRGAKG